MRSGTWRRVLVGSASVAVTASLLVVPASVVSSSELAEAPAQEPVATVAEEPADSAIAPRRDNSQIFGETLVRLKVSMGEDDPVARGKVLVSSVEGKLLLRGYTNAVGQVVFLTQQKLPDRVVVRVKGGQSKGLKGDLIDLRAFFEPRDGEVVDVNPLTTMDELCRSGNYGTYCSTAVDSFYRLKGSVDYRDLVAISDRWFDGSRFGREAAKRGLTTWQWAERVLLKAYAGKKAPKVRASTERSDASPRSAAATAASWTFASVGSSLMRSAAGGIAGSLAARYFNKLMVAAGVFEGEPDIIGEIDSLRREMREHFAEVQRGIKDLKEGQARLQASIDGLAAAASDARYQAAVRSFNTNGRGNRITSLVDSWQFLVEFAACMEQERPGCTSRAQQSAQSAEDINACTSATAAEAPAGAGRQLVVLCAEFRRLLREYSRDFTIQGVRDVVLGTPSTGTQGLVPLAQDHYARYTLGGIVTGTSQATMVAMGSYWMGEWAKDKAAWALIVADPILGGSIRGESADQAWRKAQALQTEYVSANADTSGRYFPERLSPGCGDAVFFDVSTGHAYTRGVAHFFKRDGQARMMLNEPHIAVPENSELWSFMARCDQVRPAEESALGWRFARLGQGWRAVPAGAAGSLGGVIGHLRATQTGFGGSDANTNPMRIALGDWRALGDGERYLGCYQVKLAEHHHRAGGSLISCPYVDYANSSSAQLAMASQTHFAMSCASIEAKSYIEAVPEFRRWARVLDSERAHANPARSCAAVRIDANNWMVSYLFPGFYGEAWESNLVGCGLFCLERHRGPWKLARSWAVGDSAGSGHAYNFLPHYYDRVPEQMRNTGQVTTSVPYQLLRRSMVAVPRV